MSQWPKLGWETHICKVSVLDLSGNALGPEGWWFMGPVRATSAGRGWSSCFGASLGKVSKKACRALRSHRIWKFYLAPSAKAPLNSLDLSLWWWQYSCPMLHMEGLCFSGVRLDCLLNETIVDLFWGVRHLLSVFGHIQLVCSWFPFFVLHRSGAICNVFQLFFVQETTRIWMGKLLSSASP